MICHQLLRQNSNLTAISAMKFVPRIEQRNTPDDDLSVPYGYYKLLHSKTSPYYFFCDPTCPSTMLL